MHLDTMGYLSIPLFTDSFTEDTHCHLSFTYMKLETLATFVCCGALLNCFKVGLKKNMKLETLATFDEWIT